MKAIIITGEGKVALNEVPQPDEASSGHVIIKMKAMGINAGDKFLISGNYPPGFFTQSLHNIAGVSGVGEVIQLGEGVPDKFLGRQVTVYRSLTKSENVVGTWSEYAQLPYLQCAILPDEADPLDYTGSLVNIITAYGAWKQLTDEGHKGVVITAGNSDTGKAMLGICQHADVPVIAIVRNEQGRKELEELGARHILIQGTEDFQQQFAALANELKTTAVFDGVGGALLGELLNVVPAGSTIYAYGFLGGNIPVAFHTGILIKGITIKGFSNFNTATVQDHDQLALALEEISKIIHMPHFKFKSGKDFQFEQVNEALAFVSSDGGKATLLASSASGSGR
ncbi:NADPH:quinone reductase [Pedobacter westerhofensis]|uniref:NADPH:quinone reductase n=1 Tax=Pedobacter westerhofensis TaxID=425512 RepID=A0A521AY29_9SPHI|nr:zinc-binding dehydrogenase [Pedobacter westerhofensis]SMO39716.1 NADPH:quinone reductase [Pedobacter westerhofensis]